MSVASQDPRIITNFESLLKLQGKATGFSFLPHHHACSRLAGRHQSKFRGRGLNFEEFRHYQHGDDVRNLDWRVTMRTGHPHLRVYSEEKDLPIILVIDQRQSMFFSSVDTMKSVIAAELSALSAWRIQKDNDRVGAIIFNDHNHHWIKPQRSRDHVMRMLRGVTGFNQQLANFETSAEKIKSSHSLARTLKHLAQLKLKNSLIIFLSDFKGLNSANADNLKSLQANNDVMGVMIADPMELDLKLTSDFYASDGELQVALPQNDKHFTQAFTDCAKQHQTSVQSLFTHQGIPLVEINTNGQHLSQFQQQIAGVVYATK